MRHNVTIGIDDERGIPDQPVLPLDEHRTGNKPDAVTAGVFLENTDHIIGIGLCVTVKRAIGREFAEKRHLHPGETRHQDIEPLAHTLYI